MTRKDFLHQLGVGAAFALTVPCLHSCSGDDDGEAVTPPSGDVVLDLDDPAYATLATPGNYVVVDKVVVARTLDGGYAAATQLCTHASNLNVFYNANDETWNCDVHGAVFDLASGAPDDATRADLTERAIAVYPTALEGRILTVSVG